MMPYAITALGLVLFTMIAIATINHRPTPTLSEEETFTLIVDGMRTLESAFTLRAESTEELPSENAQRLDGGLEEVLHDYLPFIPRAPYGYNWAFGFTSEDELRQDGYAGEAAGGKYWFCLYPALGDVSREQAIAFKWAKHKFPSTQYYLTSGDRSACGRAVNFASSTQLVARPVVTFFVDVPERAAPSEPTVGTHFATSSASLQGNGKHWRASAKVCVYGTNGEPLTGMSAGVEVRITDLVRTWDNQETERSFLTQQTLDDTGCAIFERKPVAVPSPGKEGVEAVRIEVTNVHYWWPTNPTIQWNGIRPALEIKVPQA